MLVDFPPSGIRSVLMLAAVYFAYVTGRKSQGTRMLIMAVTLMLALNPRILLADLGFQLSALAMWGLIVFYPFLVKKLSRWIEISGILNVAIMTFCAIVMTTPILGYAFGRISFIGLISNIVAAPLYTLIMLIGFLLLIFGWVPFLGNVLAFSAHFLTSFFLDIVNYSSRLPGGAVEVNYFNGNLVLGCYFLLFILSIIVSSETRKQFWPIVSLEKTDHIIENTKSVQDEQNLERGFNE